MNTAYIRFYEELNDFLPIGKRKKTITYNFYGSVGVKDIIEAHGVPHSEVDLVLVNSESVPFDCKIKNNDYISVYPVFETLDISGVTLLRSKPLKENKFIVDVNLGKLVKYLRLLGFNTKYSREYEDNELARISKDEERILLTRDRTLLKRKIIERGYFVRSEIPRLQIKEIVSRFNLKNYFAPFIYCMLCNGKLSSTAKEEIISKIPERILKSSDEFFRCSDCGHIYWKGSHYKKMSAFIRDLIQEES